MGQEAPCTAHFDGRASAGKALLETDALIFRGDFRLAIPLKEVQTVEADQGRLRVVFAKGEVILDLGRDRWLSVRSTIGVSRLFTRQDGRPVPVPTGIVESLIERSDGKLTRLDAGLVKGQQVRILCGPFADFVGTLERLDDAGRVKVLLEMMGTAVPVTLHRSVLSPAA